MYIHTHISRIHVILAYSCRQLLLKLSASLFSAMAANQAAAAPAAVAGSGGQQQHQLRTFGEEVTRALVAHDRRLAELSQCVETDVLVWDDQVRQQLVECLGRDPGTNKRVAAFKLVAAHLSAKGAQGGEALSEIDDETLEESVLRFKSKHWGPKEGKPWKFTLAPALSQTSAFRTAVADAVAGGGSDTVLFRRPQLYLGPTVQRLADDVLGKNKGKKGKGEGKKGKGDGKGKGKKGKKGKPAQQAGVTASAPLVSTGPATPVFSVPASAPPGGTTVSNASATSETTTDVPVNYAAVAAADEASALLGESTAEDNVLDLAPALAEKRSASSSAGAPPSKKSPSPAVERRRLQKGGASHH